MDCFEPIAVMPAKHYYDYTARGESNRIWGDVIPLAGKLFFYTTVSILIWLTPISAFAQLDTKIEVKPSGLHLDQPPVQEIRLSFNLRHKEQNGPMNVLSVMPADPAIIVDLKENTAGKIYVISAVLPAGYKTPSREPAEIVITTDVKDQPSIRIPITVFTGTLPPRASWLVQAEPLIGKPASAATLESLDGKMLRVGPKTGKITVIMFWAPWCEHCSKHLSTYQRISASYADKNIAFLMVCAGESNHESIDRKMKQFGANLPTGLDVEYRLSRKYEVVAYPMVFVIGRTGMVEAIHGRHSLVQPGWPDGLENFEGELEAQLDLLLAGKTRADFPNKKNPSTSPAGSTQPAVGSTSRPTDPVLVVNASDLNVGEQKPNARVVHKIVYRNTGAKDLKITAISIPDGVSISPDYPKSLPSSGLGVLRCEFTAPQEPGDFKHPISIESNDPEHPTIQIDLSGRIEG